MLSGPRPQTQIYTYIDDPTSHWVYSPSDVEIIGDHTLVSSDQASFPPIVASIYKKHLHACFLFAFGSPCEFSSFSPFSGSYLLFRRILLFLMHALYFILYFKVCFRVS
ncbi:hypothetical protein NMG60_11026849 [Bertholletia excelsa]